MQTKATAGISVGLILALTVFTAGLVHAQAVPAPKISVQGNGSYTVSYGRCASCWGDGLEVLLPNASHWKSAGSGDISVTNAVPGVYRYRVVYVRFARPAAFQPVNGPEASVVIGPDMQAYVPQRPSLRDQIAAEFSVFSGDIDGNGLHDLYIRRISPTPNGSNGTISDVLLRQNNRGSFESSLPTRQELAISAGWQPASIRVGKRDVNIDGYVDLILTGVNGVDGFVRASNQILFAPGATDSRRPPAVRAVDTGLARFSGDLDRHLVSPDYYLNHVPARYELMVYYALSCSWPLYGYTTVLDTFTPWSCFSEPQYLYVAYRDYSVFDRNAMEIAGIDHGIIHGIERADTGLVRIANKIATILGVAIGGWDINELLGPVGVVNDEQDQLAVGLFSALAGISEAVAQTANDDRRDATAERVELRGRRVLGQGPFHTALQFRQSTVSAHDSDPRPFWDGELVSHVDWPRDHPGLTLRMGFVDGPAAPLLYWNSIRGMDSRYGDDLPYDLFPSLGQGGYNSNSYVSGLVKATLGTPTIQVESFVGGERPVPVSAFN